MLTKLMQELESEWEELSYLEIQLSEKSEKLPELRLKYLNLLLDKFFSREEFFRLYQYFYRPTLKTDETYERGICISRGRGLGEPSEPGYAETKQHQIIYFPGNFPIIILVGNKKNTLHKAAEKKDPEGESLKEIKVKLYIASIASTLPGGLVDFAGGLVDFERVKGENQYEILKDQGVSFFYPPPVPRSEPTYFTAIRELTRKEFCSTGTKVSASTDLFTSFYLQLRKFTEDRLKHVKRENHSIRREIGRVDSHYSEVSLDYQALKVLAGANENGGK